MKIELPDRIEYKNDKGQLHRLDGPAREWKHGDKEWWINNKLHREDGPAVEWVSGRIFYYLDNMEYSEEQYQTKVIKLKLNRLIIFNS